MADMSPSKAKNLYWGSAPLPAGAECLGEYNGGPGRRGALIRLANGVLVQGNAGVIRTIPSESRRQATQGVQRREKGAP